MSAALKRKAVAGVDGVRWEDYEADLESRLEDLHGRVHRGAYRPQPSRRVYIPKADCRQRPLAIAALEDKIVQDAAVMALNAIHEEDFLGLSYGFRPGRGPHDALDALVVGIGRRKVSRILDADIRDFFGSVSTNPQHAPAAIPFLVIPAGAKRRAGSPRGNDGNTTKDRSTRMARLARPFASLTIQLERRYIGRS